MTQGNGVADRGLASPPYSMAPPPSPPAGPPSEASPPFPAQLCGYSVVEALSPRQTYLAIGPGGRGVVLKRLDGDCLLGGLLHHAVRERLSRVRELAHAGVANLYGVGVNDEHDDDDGGAYLIWEHVDGTPLDVYAIHPSRSPRDVAMLVRELVLAVEALHMQGLVHGALKGPNAIVVPGARGVRLIHLSPLLYSDPGADVDAVVRILKDVLDRRGEQGGPLRKLVDDAARQPMALRSIASRLAGLAEPPDAASASAERRHRGERGTRRRTLIGAVAVAAAGFAVAWGVWHAAGEPSFPLRLP